MAGKTRAWMRTYEIDSDQGRYLFAVTIVDVSDPAQVGRAFGQAGEQLAIAEKHAAENTEGRVMHSILVFGAKPEENRAEEIHAAYNEIWHKNPDLWEAIQERELPLAVWLIDAENRPYHTIIQPSLDRDYELWGATDVRKSERFRDYQMTGGQWELMLFPVGEDLLAEAQAHVRAQR